MANSLFSSLYGAAPVQPRQAQQQTSPVAGVLSLLRNGGNPIGILQSMAAKNPGMNDAIEAMNQSGGDARAAFYALAKKKGVDPDQVIAQVSGMMK